MKTTKLKTFLSWAVTVMFALVLTACIGAPLWVAFMLISVSAILSKATGMDYSMLSTCAVISASIDVSCANPITGGTSDRLILFNKADIDTITRNGTNARIIEAITLASGKKAYFYQGKNGSLQPKASMIVKKYAKPYDHIIDGVVFDVTDATKEQLEKLAQGLVCAIVEYNFQNGTTGDTAFEVYGLEAGLDLNKLDRDPSNLDDLGAYVIQLQSRVNAKEGKLPQSFFKTDYTTTLGLVNGML